MPPSTAPSIRAPRRLATAVVDALHREIRDGNLATGDRLPTEAQIMSRHGVSRTVVREALSQMQAAGLVDTRQGVGTFVAQVGRARQVALLPSPQQLHSLREAVARLEMRIGLEGEAAVLAAQRRTAQDLRDMRSALDAFMGAVIQGGDSVKADFDFHLALSHATHNELFAQWLDALGTEAIPRAKLDRLDALSAPQRKAYLLGVQAEHESIFAAIERHDSVAAQAAMRTHLVNGRERRERMVRLADEATEAPPRARPSPPQ